MRRVLYALLTVASISFISCSKENGQGGDDRKVFRFTAGSEGTKSYLYEGKKIGFNQGEQFSIFCILEGQVADSNVLFQNVSETGPVASLETQEESFIFGDPSIAFFPYNDLTLNTDVPESWVVSGLKLPTYQTAAEGTFDPSANLSWALTNSTYLNFKTCFSVAKVTVKRNDISRIVLSADEPISGDFNMKINPSTKNYTIEVGDTVVFVELNAAEALKDTTYYITFFGDSLTNFTLAAIDANGDTVMCKTKDSAYFAPNTVYDLGEIKEVIAEDLTQDGYHCWTSAVPPTQPTMEQTWCEYVIGESTGQPYGHGSVVYLQFAKIDGYDRLEVTVTDGIPRFCMNRDIDQGQAPDHLIDIPSVAEQTARYETERDNGDGTTTYIINIALIKKDKGYAHLHAIKGANWANVTVTSMKLIKE